MSPHPSLVGWRVESGEWNYNTLDRTFPSETHFVIVDHLITMPKPRVVSLALPRNLACSREGVSVISRQVGGRGTREWDWSARLKRAIAKVSVNFEPYSGFAQQYFELIKTFIYNILGI